LLPQLFNLQLSKRRNSLLLKKGQNKTWPKVYLEV